MPSRNYCMKAPRRPGDPRWPWFAARENLQREVKSLEQKIGALMIRLEELQRDHVNTVRERDKLQHDLENALAQLAQLKR